MLRLLAYGAQDALNQFDTSREHDDELLRADAELRLAEEERSSRQELADSSDDEDSHSTNKSAASTLRLSMNARNCILQRRHEKEVLEYVLQLEREVDELVTEMRAAALTPLPAPARTSRIAATQRAPSEWDCFVMQIIQPRYGSGQATDYVLSVILPLLQHEFIKLRQANNSSTPSATSSSIQI
jgi:hypothetical protein